MEVKHLWGVFFVCTLASVGAHSGTKSQVVTYSDQSNSEKSGYEINKSKSMPWEKWQLTEQDWIKYKQHMSGPRGIWSPALDPLTVLGVEASSEEERQTYARKLAMLEFERAEKELAFQRSYDKAMKSLYPNTPMIDVTKLPEVETSKIGSLKMSAINIKAERLMFFTNTGQCDNCDQTMKKIVSNWINYGGSVDIYVLGAKTDNAIRDWAKKMNVNPDWVNNKQVTLNHEKGMLFMISNGMKDVPWISVKRNNKYLGVQ